MCLYSPSYRENVTCKNALINKKWNHSTDFSNYFSFYFFSFFYFRFIFLPNLSSLPENTNLSMRLFLSAVDVVGLEAGVVPVFWSDCFLLRALRARRASLTWCRNIWVMNTYIYSVTSIQPRARRLAKFVLFIDVSLYQGSFSYTLLLLE